MSETFYLEAKVLHRVIEGEEEEAKKLLWEFTIPELQRLAIQACTLKDLAWVIQYEKLNMLRNERLKRESE